MPQERFEMNAFDQPTFRGLLPLLAAGLVAGCGKERETSAARDVHQRVRLPPRTLHARVEPQPDLSDPLFGRHRPDATALG